MFILPPPKKFLNRPIVVLTMRKILVPLLIFINAYCMAQIVVVYNRDAKIERNHSPQGVLK